MVVEPKFRNNIFMNAHPAGCAAEVERQVAWVRSKPRVSGPKRVLVVGASTGYGLASRIVAAFGAGASTVGVAFEKEGSEKRTGTAGWYNMQAFDAAAARDRLSSASLNADAFSDEVKAQTVSLVKEKLGEIDLLVYSLASPVRTDPKTGEMYRSVLKPIGSGYSSLSVDIMSGEVKDFSVEAATAEEIEQTVKVMGGEDWRLWVDALDRGGVIAKGMKTVAFSYIGPSVTSAIYRAGTIGRAKEDLERTAHDLTRRLSSCGGAAFVSVNKAVVTRSSAVIPVVPLYISILFKVMKKKGVHEGCIEQMYRLFADRLYAGANVAVDEEGRIRLDDLEMRADVQNEVQALMRDVTTENLEKIADVAGYRRDFFQIHGFDVEGVDYAADVAT